MVPGLDVRRSVIFYLSFIQEHGLKSALWERLLFLHAYFCHLEVKIDTRCMAIISALT